jgi:hypothetical protein
MTKLSANKRTGKLQVSQVQPGGGSKILATQTEGQSTTEFMQEQGFVEPDPVPPNQKKGDEYDDSLDDLLED